jgi:uncharacterized protein YndB with AHSA1/START domain
MRSAEFWVQLSRTLPASRTAVYRALTDPALLAEWWGPHGFTTPGIEFEPKIGGNYRIAMQPPEGDVFFLLGEFRRVEPPAHLAFTFRWDPPDPDDQDTLASLSLEDRGEETDVSFSQGPFATEARRALHEQGWTEGFDRLEQLLTRTAAERPDQANDGPNGRPL